jgi:hypothetical protein
MGFFSFKTADTNESIPNAYSIRDPFPVYMFANTHRVYEEHNYQGMGIFGGYDFFVLLAEMNGYPSDRRKGIDLYYSDRDDIMYPQLLKNKEYPTHAEYFRKPELCEIQGFFYEK